MADLTPNLKLPLLVEGQDQGEFIYNQSMMILDAIAGRRVLDKDLTAPPGSPSEGDVYIVAPGATGDWSGKDNQIAYFLNNMWNFIVPENGLEVYVVDEGLRYIYNGSTWEITGSLDKGANLLVAYVNSNGSIAAQSSALGASISVSSPGVGIYDCTFTGIAAGNVAVFAEICDEAPSGSPNNHTGPVTAKNATAGFPTYQGARVRMVHPDKQYSCGGCTEHFSELIDAPFLIKVVRM